jgi:hypothetical protein
MNGGTRALEFPKKIFYGQVMSSMVARWYVFKPKIPIWVNFGGPWNGKCGYILRPFGICLGHLE